MRPISTVSCAIICTVSAASTYAQTAGMLSFQAQLNQGGVSFDGTVNLVFRIYDAESGGNLVDLNGDGFVNDVVGEDAQTVIGVEVTGGLLTTKWGPISPKAFDGADRWVEVTANGELLSRFEIVTPTATAEQLNAPGTGEAVAQTDVQGHLGIGTSNANAKLEVVGNAALMGTGIIASTPGNVTITGSGTAFTTQVRVGDLLVVSLPTPQERLIVTIIDDSTLEVETPFSPELPAQAFTFQRPVACFTQDDGEQSLTVTADGRVGIGTDIPSTSLEVIGEARFESLSGDWDQSDSGFVRFGDLQICWGQYLSDGSPIDTTFPAPFIDANYRVIATPDGDSAPNLTVTIQNKTTVNFQAQTFSIASGFDGNDGDYIAIGRWR